MPAYMICEELCNAEIYTILIHLMRILWYIQVYVDNEYVYGNKIQISKIIGTI